MSLLSHDSMTNHHDGLLGSVLDLLETWRHRAAARRELAHWSERDLHDIGLSYSDVASEIEKPFWRQ